jgi:hypothetical protein
VLDNADGMSSLVTSLFKAVELLMGRIDSVVDNGVRWGTRSALVATLSHFLELKSERKVDLIEDQVHTLWTQVRAASDSLVSHCPPSVARSPPDGAGE